MSTRKDRAKRLGVPIDQIPMDWIDEERNRRSQGINHALTQSQHAAVNARHPGTTLEYCCECGNPTGNAGAGDGSLYTEDGDGPFCWDCFPEKEEEDEVR